MIKGKQYDVLICFVYSMFEKKFIKNIINVLEARNQNCWEKGKYKIIKIVSSVYRNDVKEEFNKVIKENNYDNLRIKVVYLCDKKILDDNEAIFEKQDRKKIKELYNEKSVKCVQIQEIEETIEDIIKLDMNGIYRFLKVDKPEDVTDLHNSNGLKLLKEVFLKNGEFYIRDMILEVLDYLDYEKIVDESDIRFLW